MKIIKPGIYRDIASSEYFADPCPEPSLSQSICKVLIESSPLHASFEHPRLKPHDREPETYDKVKAIGNAAHKIMLGRGKEVVVISADDFRTREARARRDEILAIGDVPLLEKHLDEVASMVDAARRQLRGHEDKDAFTAGSAEVMIAWEEGGIWYRALIDWLSDDLRTIDDFKTTGMSVAPHKLGHLAESAGWHVQAAFIERGLDVFDPAGAGRRRFRFIAQEQYQPYALSVAHMDEHWLTMGRKQVAAADRMWRSAIQSGNWHGYPARSVIPDYPAWSESRWLEREERGEFDASFIMAG